MIFEVAHQMGAVPLVWLAWLHFRGEQRDVAWWWLAGAFFISWIADSIAHVVQAPLIGMAYPVTQGGIVAAVFLSRRDAMWFVAALVIVGGADVLWRGLEPHDILLRTVAWGSAAGIIYQLPQLGRLRTSLLVTFGLGLLSWYGYALWPGWSFYLVYQSTRLLGILLFCWAATDPLPHFKLSVR